MEGEKRFYGKVKLLSIYAACKPSAPPEDDWTYTEFMATVNRKPMPASFREYMHAQQQAYRSQQQSNLVNQGLMQPHDQQPQQPQPQQPQGAMQ